MKGGGRVWGRGIVCLCRVLETCMPAGRKAKGAKMKAFYALLQPQESDRVDNEWEEEQEAQEENWALRKQKGEKIEERREEKKKWVPDSTCLTSTCLVSAQLDSTASKCQEQRNQRLTQFRIPCKVNWVEMVVLNTGLSYVCARGDLERLKHRVKICRVDYFLNSKNKNKTFSLINLKDELNWYFIWYW